MDSLSSGLNDSSILLSIVGNLASTYLAVGNYKEAEIRLKQGIELMKAIDDPYNLGAFYGLLGQVYKNQGRIKEGLESMLYSLKHERDSNWHGKSLTTNSIGYLYLNQTKNDEALKSFKESLLFSKKANFLAQVGKNYQAIGETYATLGDYTIGYTYIDSARVIYENINSNYLLTGIAISKGKMYFNDKDYKNSEIELKKSLVLSEDADLLLDWTEAASQLAVIYNRQGKYKEAVELTENGCVDTSDCVNISTTGLNSNTLGSLIKVYPNPTMGQLTVDLGRQYNSVSYSITDIKGKMILKNKSNQVELIELEINGSVGVYFLKIISEDQSAVIRIIKD